MTAAETRYSMICRFPCARLRDLQVARVATTGSRHEAGPGGGAVHGVATANRCIVWCTKPGSESTGGESTKG
jgi:hypothetical protein